MAIRRSYNDETHSLSPVHENRVPTKQFNLSARIVPPTGGGTTF